MNDEFDTIDDYSDDFFSDSSNKKKTKLEHAKDLGKDIGNELFGDKDKVFSTLDKLLRASIPVGISEEVSGTMAVYKAAKKELLEASNELRGVATETTKIVNTIIPDGKLSPIKSLLTKLEKSMSADKAEKEIIATVAKTIDDIRNDEYAAILKKLEEKPQSEATTNSIANKQAAANLAGLEAILARVDTVAEQGRIGIGGMKEGLNIGLKGLYASVQHSKMVDRRLTDITTLLTNIEAQVKLPDMAKIGTKASKDAIATNFGTNPSPDKIFKTLNPFASLQANITRNIVWKKEQAKQALMSGNEIMTQLATARNMASGFDMPLTSMIAPFITDGIINIAGGQIKKSLATNKLSQKLMFEFKDASTDISKKLKDMSGQVQGDGFTDNLKRKALNLASSLSNSYGQENILNITPKDMNKPATFDNRAWTSLVQIIPKALFSIHSELKAARLGSNKPEEFELSYDYEKSTYIDAKEFKHNLRDKVTNQVNRTIKYDVNSFLGMIEENLDGITLTERDKAVIRRSLITYAYKTRNLTPSKLLAKESSLIDYIGPSRLKGPVTLAIQGMLAKAKKDTYYFDRIARSLKNILNGLPNMQKFVQESVDSGQTEKLVKLGVLVKNPYGLGYTVNNDKLAKMAGGAMLNDLTAPTRPLNEFQQTVASARDSVFNYFKPKPDLSNPNSGSGQNVNASTASKDKNAGNTEKTMDKDTLDSVKAEYIKFKERNPEVATEFKEYVKHVYGYSDATVDNQLAKEHDKYRKQAEDLLDKQKKAIKAKAEEQLKYFKHRQVSPEEREQLFRVYQASPEYRNKLVDDSNFESWLNIQGLKTKMFKVPTLRDILTKTRAWDKKIAKGALKLAGKGISFAPKAVGAVGSAAWWAAKQYGTLGAYALDGIASVPASAIRATYKKVTPEFVQKPLSPVLSAMRLNGNGFMGVTNDTALGKTREVDRNIPGAFSRTMSKLKTGGSALASIGAGIMSKFGGKAAGIAADVVEPGRTNPFTEVKPERRGSWKEQLDAMAKRKSAAEATSKKPEAKQEKSSILGLLATMLIPAVTGIWKAISGVPKLLTSMLGLLGRIPFGLASSAMTAGGAVIAGGKKLVNGAANIVKNVTPEVVKSKLGVLKTTVLKRIGPVAGKQILGRIAGALIPGVGWAILAYSAGMATKYMVSDGMPLLDAISKGFLGFNIFGSDMPVNPDGTPIKPDDPKSNQGGSNNTGTNATENKTQAEKKPEPKGYMENFKEKFSDAYDKFKAGASSVATTVTNAISSGASAISSGASTVYQAGKDIVSGAVGWLSAHFESGGNYGDVSNDNSKGGFVGAKAFGKYQFNSRTGFDLHKKMMAQFPELNAAYQNTGSVESSEYIAAWKALAKGPKAKEFAAAQDALGTTGKGGNPAIAIAHAKKLGIDVDKYPVLKEVIISTANALGGGGASTILNIAFKGKDTKSMTETDMVNVIYDVRTERIPYNYTENFNGKHTQRVRDIWYKRMPQERAMALAAIGKQQPTASTTTTGNVPQASSAPSGTQSASKSADGKSNATPVAAANTATDTSVKTAGATQVSYTPPTSTDTKPTSLVDSMGALEAYQKATDTAAGVSTSKGVEVTNKLLMKQLEVAMRTADLLAEIRDTVVKNGSMTRQGGIYNNQEQVTSISDTTSSTATTQVATTTEAREQANGRRQLPSSTYNIQRRVYQI